MILDVGPFWSHLNPYISETVRACLVKSDLDLKYKFDKEHKEKNHQDELKLEVNN